MPLFAFDTLLAVTTECLERVGMAKPLAGEVADMFVVTEASGVHSHGLALFGKHLEQMKKGCVNLAPRVAVVREAGAFAVVDGDGGPGPVVINRALDIGMQKAADNGVASLWITNLQHHAAGLYHVLRPVRNGMIAILCANAPASVAPYGGKAKLLGTNPLTFGAPAGAYPPYILDMATSVVAGNKIEQLLKAGKKAPPGYGLDRDGKPTNDPEEILLHGVLLPFGGAKGSGISGMVNILSGMPSGGAFLDDVVSLCRDPAKPANFGFHMHLIDIAVVANRAAYDERMEQWIAMLLRCPPAVGFDSVVYPGYHEGTRLEKSLRDGVDIPDSSLRQLLDAGRLVGVDVEEALF